MKLLLVGRAGAGACDWSGYALLRDNVQHFMEGGEPSERFVALHAIEAAVDSGRCRVEAARLRGEVLRAWYALCRVPFSDAAVSVRTRAILTGSAERPTARGTVRASHTGWRLPGAGGDSAAVAESAKKFVATVLSLTERVVDGDTLEVRRHGAAPRFIRRSSDASCVTRATRPGAGRSWVTAVGMLALGVACSAPRVPSPETPSVRDSLGRCSELARGGRPTLDGPCVAPPPAYGNKVVKTLGARCNTECTIARRASGGVCESSLLLAATGGAARC